MSEFFAAQESFFRRLHPSGKMTALLLVFVAALMLDDPRYVLILWVIAIPAGFLSGAFRLLRKLWPIFLAVALASFILWAIFTREGSRLASFNSLWLTRQGVLYAAGMSLRLSVMLFFGLVFIASTPVEDLYYGLVKMGLPFPASFALSLSFRLVPIFSESAKTILQAQRSRGLETGGGLISRFKSYFPLFVPVFLFALRRVDQLSIALESRGFGAGIKRTSYIQFSLSALDFVVLGFCLALATAFVALRMLGLGMVKF
jgi:energy-coupling factor transport system permease protein